MRALAVLVCMTLPVWADVSAPAPAPAPAAVTRACGLQEWRSIKHALIRHCRRAHDPGCPALLRDLTTKVWCDGEERRTAENRARCSQPSMVRETSKRCERSAEGVQIYVDCWDWTIRFKRRPSGGYVFGSITAGGVCD